MNRDSFEFKLTYLLVIISFFSQTVMTPIMVVTTSWNTQNVWVLILISGLYVASALGFHEIVISETRFITPFQKLKILQLTRQKIRPGFIYVMKRGDGIYKLGQTVDTYSRLKQHRKDYQSEFFLVKRFVVADVIKFEKLALEMTLKYQYKEEGRNELRKMNDIEMSTFLVKFENICKENVCA